MIKNNFKKIVGLIAAFLFSGYVAAQLDSIQLDSMITIPDLDINLEASFQQPVLIADAMDSIFLAGTDLQEIILSLELTDTTFELGRVWIELILLPSGFNATLLSHNSFTTEELEQQELLVGDLLTYSFGYYSTSAKYEIAVRIEDVDGNQVRLITNTLEQ